MSAKLQQNRSVVVLSSAIDSTYTVTSLSSPGYGGIMSSEYRSRLKSELLSQGPRLLYQHESDRDHVCDISTAALSGRLIAAGNGGAQNHLGTSPDLDIHLA